MSRHPASLAVITRGLPCLCVIPRPYLIRFRLYSYLKVTLLFIGLLEHLTCRHFQIKAKNVFSRLMPVRLTLFLRFFCSALWHRHPGEAGAHIVLGQKRLLKWVQRASVHQGFNCCSHLILLDHFNILFKFPSRRIKRFQ